MSILKKMVVMFFTGIFLTTGTLAASATESVSVPGEKVLRENNVTVSGETAIVSCAVLKATVSGMTDSVAVSYFENKIVDSQGGTCQLTPVEMVCLNLYISNFEALERYQDHDLSVSVNGDMYSVCAKSRPEIMPLAVSSSYSYTKTDSEDLVRLSAGQAGTWTLTGVFTRAETNITGQYLLTCNASGNYHTWSGKNPISYTTISGPSGGSDLGSNPSTYASWVVQAEEKRLSLRVDS